MVESGEEFRALGHRLWVAVDPPQTLDRGTGHPEQAMANPEPNITYEVELAVEEDVIDLRDRSRSRVLHGENGDICSSLLHGTNRIGECR